MGASLDADNVLDVAKQGLRFYEDFLNRAEAFFVK
jgi:hypothetical protein